MHGVTLTKQTQADRGVCLSSAGNETQMKDEADRENPLCRLQDVIVTL